MNVILSRIKRNPQRFPKAPGWTKRQWSKETLDVYVGGLEINGEDERNDRHVEWLKRYIKPGDRLVVKVLPPGRFDTPRPMGPRRPPTRAKAARAARRRR